MNLFPNRR